MKKPILAIIIGVSIGGLLLLGVFLALIMRPNNKDVLAQSEENIESEWGTQVEEEWIEETELIDVGTEEIIVEEIESEESETVEQPKAPVAQKQPVNHPYYIRVNRQANCVTIYTKDANGNYTVPVKAMTCSVGLTGITPLGITKITERYVWRPLFGGSYGHYTVRFNGHILFHSVPYVRTSKDSLVKGQYNMLGQPASQGCVRLSVIDAKWIYDNCANGTKVEVYDSPDPGPLGKPEPYRINDNSPFCGWDPTDPDPGNPWKQGKVTIYGVKDIVINQGEQVNLLAGVSANDVDGLPLQVAVSNTVDFQTPGVYTVTYSATGVLRMTETVSVTVTVNYVAPPVDSETPENPESPGDSETPESPETPVNPEAPETLDNVEDIEEDGINVTYKKD